QGNVEDSPLTRVPPAPSRPSSGNLLLLPCQLPRYEMIGISQSESYSGVGTAALSRHAHGHRRRGNSVVVPVFSLRSVTAERWQGRASEVWHVSCFLSHAETCAGFLVP